MLFVVVFVCFLYFISILGGFVVNKAFEKKEMLQQCGEEFETLYHHHTFKQNTKVERISALCGYSQQLSLHGPFFFLH